MDILSPKQASLVHGSSLPSGSPLKSGTLQATTGEPRQSCLFLWTTFSGFQRHTGAATEAPYYHLSTIVDLFGSCKFNEDVAFDFSAENVGDRYYLDPLSTGLVLAPSRSFKMSLSARFCAFTG